MLKAILLLFLIGQASAAATSQTRPEFDGTWELEDSQPAASDVPRRLVIRHDKNTSAPAFDELVVERALGSNVRSTTYRIGLVGGVVGGVDKEGRGSGPDGHPPRTQFFVRWDPDNRLVIETASYSGLTRAAGPYSEHMEVWWLDSAGKLVMTVEHRTDAGGTTRTLTYRREQ